MDLCGLLGIEVAALAAVERSEELVHSFSLESSDAARLDLPQVHAFVEHYRDLAKIEIRTGDLTELEIQPGVTDAAVMAFADGARSGGPYEAIVRVNKKGLAQSLLAGPAQRAVRVFLFGESLRRALSQGITRFEAEVWVEAPAPLVVAVLDTNVRLVGPQLSVLGGEALDEVSATVAAPATTADFGALSEIRDLHIGWDKRWVQHLTPWHLFMRGTSSDPELQNLLRSQFVKLAILFTCDRARGRSVSTVPDQIRAEYRGREHVAVVPIDERAPLSCTDSEMDAVMRAVDWCYARHGGEGQPDWVSDRLPFLQTRVAQVLEPHPATGRLRTFAQAMPFLLEGVEWHWKAFIEGKVSHYLDRVQQVEDTVTETVATLADRTASLTKSLSDAMLAAVAVLIGSFVAAAFSTPFNGTLFRVGVLTYAAYLLLFPGAVGILTSVSNQRRTKNEFDARILRFNQVLFPEKVTEIAGNRVEDARRVYVRWLVVVIVAYVAVSIAAGVAAAVIPGIVSTGSPQQQEQPEGDTEGNPTPDDSPVSAASFGAPPGVSVQAPEAAPKRTGQTLFPDSGSLSPR